jgi:hypothetical protein
MAPGVSVQELKSISGVSVVTESYQYHKDLTIVPAQAMKTQLQSGRLRKMGIDSGLILKSDLEIMGQAWEEWAEKDDASLGMMSGEVLIQN